MIESPRRGLPLLWAGENSIYNSTKLNLMKIVRIITNYLARKVAAFFIFLSEHLGFQLTSNKAFNGTFEAKHLIKCPELNCVPMVGILFMEVGPCLLSGSCIF